jgi:hypothetical protein
VFEFAVETMSAETVSLAFFPEVLFNRSRPIDLAISRPRRFQRVSRLGSAETNRFLAAYSDTS